MITRKVLLLPGMTSPKFAPNYQKLYSTVKEGAEKYGYEYHIVYYPGQEGESSGLLTYDGALANALKKGSEMEPNWIVGLSSGCEVAAGLLGSGKPLIDNIEGAVLWGPCLKETIRSIFTPEEWQKYITDSKAEPNKTYFSPDFIENTPCVSELIKKAKANIRIARGSNDKYNTVHDVVITANAHQEMNPQYLTETREIEGLKHGVLPDEISSELLDKYLKCLFDKFDN